MPTRTTLITGFPGFIGKRLVSALLEVDRKQKIICLVEPRMSEVATAAATEIDAKRVKIVTGDIGARDLGLDPAVAERLAEEMTHCFHLAAIYNLAVPVELARRINVEGTGNVLELCRAAKRFERLDYVSTAYVAGVRTGTIYEHELALGQAHKNHYESTKFQAEVWVRELQDAVPTAIYRPAIVVGDSRTGETQKFDGPYYLLRTLALSEAKGLPMIQFGRSEAAFNAVPVDFVVNALVAGSRDPQAIGRTFHLTDPNPISSGELLTAFAREYAGREPSLRVPPRLVENALRIRKVRDLYSGAPRESIRYLNHPQRFDTRQASEMLARAGVSCPRFEDYVGPLVTFFREHEEDPAFAPALGT